MTYTNFIITDDINSDVVTTSTTTVTMGLFSNDTGSVRDTLYTSTTQLNTSGEYYVDAYITNPASDELAESQFAISYGHINGGGAPTIENNEQTTLATKAIYSQYRNLLLNPTDTRFSFQGVDSDHIYVINFQRSRFKEQLDAGNWELPLSGTNGISTFIDDSYQTFGTLTANSKAGRVFSIVSGTLNSVSGSVTSSTNSATWGINGAGYGLAYPDLGILILNPDAIGYAVGFPITSGSGTGTMSSISSSAATASLQSPLYTSKTFISTYPQTIYAPVTHSLPSDNWASQKSAYNHFGLFNSIRTALTGSGVLRARSAEEISSNHYFVRLRNKAYNYSNNPTFYRGSDQTLIYEAFTNDPKVYITTIGLYNENNELLAVAKLSQPVRKSFDEEVLLRVRLDF